MPAKFPNHWKQHFDEATFRVPEWVAEKYESLSWPNDVCPHFQLPKENHTLWVDAYDPNQRECGRKRFFIAYEDDGDNEQYALWLTEREGDDAEEALKRYLDKHYK